MGSLQHSNRVAGGLPVEGGGRGGGRETTWCVGGAPHWCLS